MRRAALLSAALLSCAWLACGGGDKVPDQPPSEADQFATRYAEATCSVMGDCCKTGGFGYDSAGCKDVTSYVLGQSIHRAEATLKVHFDLAAAERCLTARVELYKSCKGDGKVELAACNAMLVGDLPVGSPCSSPLECAAAPDITVTCAPDAPSSMKGHCAVVPPTMPPPPVGKSGDACSTTCRTNASDACTNLDGVASAAACLIADGLVCDGASHVCVAVPQIGDACASFCATGAYCDPGGHCQAKTADGSCAGATDACTDVSICACGEASCDPSKFVCVPRGGTSAQCLNDTQCLSAFCYHGFCRVKTPVSEDLCEGLL
jgi:hypothetical protein